ncbi:MAG: hypothetical protein K8U57_40385 [Planctomycetes bacterium]|nr:hypothetical protein [Planctomycetota bacterium]
MLLLDPDNPTAIAAELFSRVWRTTLDQRGFAVLRFAKPVDSHELRRTIFALVEAFPVRFVAERLGRFDQQVSSKFHRDGAPTASLLLLGYEASSVRSRIFIADSSKAAVEAELPLPEFVAKFNPMFPTGEAKYLPFVTELELPHGESYIVAINNSLLPWVRGIANPLGVLHKAIIDEPDLAARRVINSVGLTLPGTGTSKTAAEVERFLTRDDVD